MYKSILSMISSLAIAGFLLMGTGTSANAQNTSTMHHKGHKTTVTGCLQKGDEANEYSIKTTDGKMYGLRSTKVQLSDHVGHTVKVHGYMAPESAEGNEANANAAGNAENGEKGDITVTSLKMVSKSCQM